MSRHMTRKKPNPPTCWDCRNSDFSTSKLGCRKDLPMDAERCKEFIDSRQESVITLQNPEMRRKR